MAAAVGRCPDIVPPGRARWPVINPGRGQALEASLKNSGGTTRSVWRGHLGQLVNNARGQICHSRPHPTRSRGYQQGEGTAAVDTDADLYNRLIRWPTAWTKLGGLQQATAQPDSAPGQELYENERAVGELRSSGRTSLRSAKVLNVRFIF